jgi:hypothetical protein
MRILLFAHPEFFFEGQGDLPPRVWIRAFADELVRTGHEVCFFDPREHKVADFDWVHVFSATEPETWMSLKRCGSRVIVTPSLCPAAPLGTGLSTRFQKTVLLAMSLIRALLQRKWPPDEEFIFYSRGTSHLFVSSGSWANYVLRNWGVSPGQVTLVSADPAQAAKRVLEICH